MNVNQDTKRPQKAVDVSIKNVSESSLNGQHLRQFAAVAKRKKRTKKPKIPLSDKEVEEAWANILNQTHFVQGGELVQEVRKKSSNVRK